jgi:hypothetical protein
MLPLAVITESVLNTLIVTLLGAGGTAFIWTLVKSVLAFRNSAESREDKAIARLEQFERDCRKQLAHERMWGSYWQRRAGVMEHALASAGIELPNYDPPPSESPSPFPL